jgi:hypothetical protein
MVGAEIGFRSRRWVPSRKNDGVWFTISGMYSVRKSNPIQVEQGLETPGYWIGLALVEDSTGKRWYGRNLHLYGGRLRGSIYGESVPRGGHNIGERDASHYCELELTRRVPARRPVAIGAEPARPFDRYGSNVKPA